MGGVAVALAAGLAEAPPEAWRGDLIMLGGMLSMALYNVLSRPLMARSSPLGYACAGMAFGSGLNALIAWRSGGFDAVSAFGPAQWAAGLYLGLFAGALGFYLWVFALERATPTRVANTITVSPLAAAFLAAILIGEPIGVSLVIGVAAVGAGIWIASTERRSYESFARHSVRGAVRRRRRRPTARMSIRSASSRWSKAWSSPGRLRSCPTAACWSPKRPAD